MSRKRQGRLFASPEEGAWEYQDPSLNLLSRLKAALRRTADQSRFSREQVVDRMNDRAREEGILQRRGRRYSLAQMEA